jgi:transcription termination factor Rho
MYDIIELNNKLVGELRDIAKTLNIPKFEALKKQELIYKILDQQAITTSSPSAPPPSEKKPHINKPEERVLRPRKTKPENPNAENKMKK